MASQLITMFRGDKKVVEFVLTLTEAGVKRLLTSVELTGVAIKFTVKRRLTDADSAAVVQLTSSTGGGIVIDAAASKAVVTIPKALTETAKAGGEPFYYDLRLIDAGNNPHTFVSDKLEVVANVTRTVPA